MKDQSGYGWKLTQEDLSLASLEGPNQHITLINLKCINNDLVIQNVQSNNK